MNLWNVLAWLGDVYILGGYATAMVTQRMRLFHWANAIGGIPLLAVEIQAHAWPVVPVTGTFTLLGWMGVLFTTDNDKEQ